MLAPIDDAAARNCFSRKLCQQNRMLSPPPRGPPPPADGAITFPSVGQPGTDCLERAWLETRLGAWALSREKDSAAFDKRTEQAGRVASSASK